MDQMIANPAMDNSTLVATTLVIAYGAGCVLFLSLQIIPPMFEAVSNSNVTTAQIEQIDDLVPDIFDEDLDPEVVAGLNEAYGDDDWPTVLNPNEIDTLPNIPGPIDNLGTVLESQSNYLIPALTQKASLLQNAMSEIRLLSPNFTLEDFRLIKLLYDSLIINCEYFRIIGVTLHNIVDRIGIGSQFWQNHPELQESFEIVCSHAQSILRPLDILFWLIRDSYLYIEVLIQGVNL